MAAEKTFETKVKKFLDEQGCYWIKTHGDRFSKKGVPDLIICCNGFFIGCELKAENGKPSELQKHHVELIQKAGGISLILYPSGYEEFKELVLFLKGFESIKINNLVY